jgi:hypothetical protein
MTYREIRLLWLHIARLREAKGDSEGATRARNVCKMISTERHRKICQDLS